MGLAIILILEISSETGLQILCRIKWVKIEKNHFVSSSLLLQDHLVDLLVFDNRPILLLLLVQHFRVLEVLNELG